MELPCLLYRKTLFLFLCLLIFLPLLGVNAETTRAQASGYDVIAAVNQLRAANGLPPYQINGSLMAAAQAHSEYMASTGAITHSGSGGTRARDRAISAGYGGGAAVFVSENIAAGYDWTAQDAVQIWQGDSLHMDTMLSSDYTDAGAGVAVSGHTVYFTLDVGYVSGSPGSGASMSGRAAVTVYPAAPPVDTATPMPDGSVIHVVQEGQALWNVAAIYGIELEELLKLNKLSTNSVIYTGDKLVVKPPVGTPTPALQETATQVPHTATKIPSATPTTLSGADVALTQTAMANLQTTPTPQSSALSAFLPSGVDTIKMVIAVLVVGGLALFIGGSIFSRFA